MNLDAIIQTLRELNEPVPKPLRLPTRDEVDNAQRMLRVAFHPDYRKYLLEASDVVYGTIEPCTVTPDGGHTDLIDVVTIAWEEAGVSRDLLPICEDNGDYYCMNSSGEVVFWSHNGLGDEKWPDLATWIEQVWLTEG
jgi:hypothetical protein